MQISGLQCTQRQFTVNSPAIRRAPGCKANRSRLCISLRKTLAVARDICSFASLSCSIRFSYPSTGKVTDLPFDFSHLTMLLHFLSFPRLFYAPLIMWSGIASSLRSGIESPERSESTHSNGRAKTTRAFTIRPKNQGAGEFASSASAGHPLHPKPKKW